MKITIIVLITVAVIEQLSFGVNGCNKDKGNKNGNSNTPATNQPKSKAGQTSKAGPSTTAGPSTKGGPKPSSDIKTLPNGITFGINALLGQGQSADVYEGQKRDGTKVAVKVFKTDTVSLDSYRDELECYKKMGATTGVQCKIYGISPIFYYGPGGGSQVLVMEMYKYTVYSLAISDVEVSVVSWFFMLLNGVIAVKFMHSKGVRHGDLHDENMMVDFNRIFFIDFGVNLFGKMNEAHDVLKMFLSICNYLNLRKLLNDFIKNMGMRVGAEKENIINQIRAKNVIHHDYARPIAEFFIEAVFANLTKRLPYYDDLYRIIEGVVYPRGYDGQPYYYNWYTQEEKVAASRIPIPSITSIQLASH